MVRSIQSSRTRHTAVRLGLSALAVGLVAALAVAPASAAPSVSPDGDTAILMNFMINSAKDAGTMDDVAAAVEDAGGEVITRYDQIGVTVAQSDRGRFAADLRAQDDLIQSVGATRTSAVFAPLAPKVGLDDLNRAAAVSTTCTRTCPPTSTAPAQPTARPTSASRTRLRAPGARLRAHTARTWPARSPLRATARASQASRPA